MKELSAEGSKTLSQVYESVVGKDLPCDEFHSEDNSEVDYKSESNFSDP